MLLEVMQPKRKPAELKLSRHAEATRTVNSTFLKSRIKPLVFVRTSISIEEWHPQLNHAKVLVRLTARTPPFVCSTSLKSQARSLACAHIHTSTGRTSSGFGPASKCTSLRSAWLMIIAYIPISSCLPPSQGYALIYMSIEARRPLSRFASLLCQRRVPAAQSASFSMSNILAQSLESALISTSIEALNSTLTSVKH